MNTSAPNMAMSQDNGGQTRAVLLALLPVAIVAILPLLPFVNDYIIAATVRALIFITLGQAWNVVAGIGGLLSLGHGVFGLALVWRRSSRW